MLSVDTVHELHASVIEECKHHDEDEMHTVEYDKFKEILLRVILYLIV